MRRLARSSAFAGSAFLALIMAACRPEPAAEPPEPKAKTGPPPAKIAITPEPTMDRESLLIAAFRARSAAAAGIDDRATQAGLDGRDFVLRIPMGCSLTAETSATNFGARRDSRRGRIDLSATPDLDLTHPLAAALDGERFEAAEGFWIPRPWLLAPACGGEDGSGPLGIAQFFTSADPRTGRRQGRAYSAREAVSEGAEPAPGSWALVLAGRLKSLDDGRVIHCRPLEVGAVPACLISVEFDRVSIENVRSEEQLAEWSSG